MVKSLKINILLLDRIILFLLSYIVLVDMVNGYFMFKDSKLPISQIFKLLLIILLLLRLFRTKEFGFIIFLFICFQIGPLFGVIKTGNFTAFFNDIVVSTKWFNVPLSFFYFKNLFQSNFIAKLSIRISQVVSRSFVLIIVNVLLGAMGFGMAFYNHGFNNAVGTKGFIYAGNELTILILALAFIIGSYYIQQKNYRSYCIMLIVFLILSFFITSKTVIGGTIVVFLIPLISVFKFRIKRKWLNWIVGTAFFGIPFILSLFYIGIAKSGIIDKIQYSLERNNYDIITVILSNRNNFIAKGWEVYMNEFSLIGKIFGYGQSYHLELSGHLAEVDFLSLLFASGIFGVTVLFIIIFYWHINAINLKNIKGEYWYAKPVLLFLWFLILAANLSGHIFGSGIAGFFIGLSLALMFYNPNMLSNDQAN